MSTQLDFYITVPRDRAGTLDRRDEIIDALKAIGLRVNLIDSGLAVFMNDEGVPTIGDVVTGRATAVVDPVSGDVYAIEIDGTAASRRWKAPPIPADVDYLNGEPGFDDYGNRISSCHGACSNCQRQSGPCKGAELT